MPRLLDHPFPRFAIPAVEFLEGIIRPGFRVLEWGAGSSTLWFAERGCIVDAVEHDPTWGKRITARLRLPSRVLGRQLGQEYLEPVSSIDDYNIIVIDGRCRCNCAEFVLGQMEKMQGVSDLWIVFDDTNRKRYRACVERMALRASSSWTYSGTSGVVLDKTTTILRMGSAISVERQVSNR